MTFEFKPEFCKRCGQQKSFYPDGRREMRRRCRCELDRVRKNNVWRVVDPEFFDAGKRLILMSAWDPPLFSKPGPFPELIRAQRVLLAGKLYEFAFRQTDDALPITRSVNGRLNLFLRGPQGAGRGLVAHDAEARNGVGSVGRDTDQHPGAERPDRGDGALREGLPLELDGCLVTPQPAALPTRQDHTHPLRHRRPALRAGVPVPVPGIPNSIE